MLSHENIVADVSATLLQLGDQKPNCTDVMMSFLPLAHMLERVCEVSVYVQGGCVGFFSGDVRNLMDDMKALRPTITPAVPRLLNRFLFPTCLRSPHFTDYLLFLLPVQNLRQGAEWVEPLVGEAFPVQRSAQLQGERAETGHHPQQHHLGQTGSTQGPGEHGRTHPPPRRRIGPTRRIRPDVHAMCPRLCHC